jgi:endonuclease G, mitochondrial
MKRQLLKTPHRSALEKRGSSKNRIASFFFRLTILIIWLALCGSIAAGEPSPDAAPYLPQQIFVIQRQGYIVAYDGQTRNASWVYEHLSQKAFDHKTIDRKSCHFKQDEKIPQPIRASLEDFRGSGYQLGHLCPFADCRGDSQAAAETFFLSNISPQKPQFNQGHWKKLEEWVRDLAARFTELHIITMPLYLPEGKRISYEIIGMSRVHVPTHFCKVIFAVGEKGIETFVYVLPNEAIAADVPLENFKTSLDAVERLSGRIFPIHP